MPLNLSVMVPITIYKSSIRSNLIFWFFKIVEIQCKWLKLHKFRWKRSSVIWHEIQTKRRKLFIFNWCRTLVYQQYSVTFWELSQIEDSIILVFTLWFGKIGVSVSEKHCVLSILTWCTSSTNVRSQCAQYFSGTLTIIIWFKFSIYLWWKIWIFCLFLSRVIRSNPCGLLDYSRNASLEWFVVL